MKEGRVTPSGLGILMYCGLLAPMFRIAPGAGAAGAQAGGWVSPLAAYLLFLAPLWVLVRVSRVLPRGEGLSRLYRLAFGEWPGRVLLLLTGLWAALSGAAALRYYSESIISTVYQDTSVWIFLIGVMLVVWRVASAGMEVLCRLARVYLLLIGVILGLVGLLSLSEISPENLWPCWTGGWRGLLTSALPVLGVQGPMVLILFRRSDGAQTLDGGRTLAAWMGGWCLTLSALRAVVIGMFGWQTAVRLQTPLFSAAKEVFLLNVFERIEALVAAVWVLSDIIWIASLLVVAWDLTGEALGRRWNAGALAALSLGILLTAGWSGGGLFLVREMLQRAGQGWNTALCYGAPLAACAVAKLRGRV